jgi:hypothetical protein
MNKIDAIKLVKSSAQIHHENTKKPQEILDNEYINKLKNTIEMNDSEIKSSLLFNRHAHKTVGYKCLCSLTGVNNEVTMESSSKIKVHTINPKALELSQLYTGINLCIYLIYLSNISIYYIYLNYM